MTERPTWHLDVETAKRECRLCFDRWLSQMNRVRELVEQRKTYAPESFKESVEELMPELRRATLVAVARLQILTQIKGGEMQWHEDEERTEQVVIHVANPSESTARFRMSGVVA